MVTRGALILLALSLLSACSIDRAVGGERDADAAPSDAGPAFDGAGPPGRDAGPVGDAGRVLGEFDSPDTGAIVCFDGLDNDSNGPLDCADRSCRVNVPACCVGVGAPECCTVADTETLPIAACRDAVALCPALLEQAVPFGAPGARVVADPEVGSALVAGGQSADSGLVLQRVVDPRSERVHVGATIAAPTRRHDRGADVIAFGLVDADAPPLAPITPTAAVLVSGNRGEVSFVVAGEIVQRWPTENALFTTYGLSLEPGGAIVLMRAGVELGRSELPWDRPLRPVIYGRTYNPSAGDPAPARLASLAVERSRCDVPSALDAAEQVLPPSDASDPAWANVRRVAAPDVVRWSTGTGTEERLAVEIDGAIHLARRSDTGRWELTAPLDAPALRAAGDGWARDGLTDPALRFEDGALELWLTGLAGGVGTVARVRARGGETFAWSDVQVMFAPSGDVTSYAQPAPHVRAGVLHVLMRVTRAGRVVLESHALDGTGYLHVRAPSHGDLFAFDRDEVASPVVATLGGIERLLFAGRRGTRWSIGMLLWVEGLGWVEPADPIVHSPSVGALDAIAARDPAVWVDGEHVELFYTAVDAASVARVAVVRGIAPSTR
jgi:hypothetical protein